MKYTGNSMNDNTRQKNESFHWTSRHYTHQLPSNCLDFIIKVVATSVPHPPHCCGCAWQMCMMAAIGDGGEVKRWVGDDGGWERMGILCWFHSDEFRQHSFQVIPGTILAEFECYSKFCWNHFINLAGHSAKFDSSGILGIAWILPDSGRNQWRTVKTSPLR